MTSHLTVPNVDENMVDQYALVWTLELRKRASGAHAKYVFMDQPLVARYRAILRYYSCYTPL